MVLLYSVRNISVDFLKQKFRLTILLDFYDSKYIQKLMKILNHKNPISINKDGDAKRFDDLIIQCFLQHFKKIYL